MGKEKVPAIDIGAKMKGDDGSVYRVTNIWIDEDGVSHVTIREQGKFPHSEALDEKLAYPDVREALSSGRFERTNSPHEAWVWRDENIN